MWKFMFKIFNSTNITIYVWTRKSPMDMLLIQRDLHCSVSREGSYCSGETAAGWVLLQE